MLGAGHCRPGALGRDPCLVGVRRLGVGQVFRDGVRLGQCLGGLRLRFLGRLFRLRGV